MSLSCGIFRLKHDTVIPDHWIQHLRANIDRRGSGTVREFLDENLFLAQLDIGAFDGSGWHRDVDRVIALNGDPIMGASWPRHRGQDVDSLRVVAFEQIETLLARSRGYFNLVAYDRTLRRCLLATDRIGLRVLYVYRDDDLIVFSGAMRLIETLPGVRLSVDLRGVMEDVCFGFPLSDRTGYSEVQCLLSGELAALSVGSVRRHRYWRFDRDAHVSDGHVREVGMKALSGAFESAVRLRAEPRKTVFAALSGGLDSRCVVTELWRQGREVNTVNVSWKGSFDDVLAKAYAEAIGCRHFSVMLPPDDAGVSVPRAAFGEVWSHSHEFPDDPVVTRQIWGGNGGSVGVGHVYMTAEACEVLRTEGAASGARQYLRDNGVALSGRLFTDELREWVEALPREGVTEELSRMQCADPARGLYVFLLENDQRRHFAFHFEDIDLYAFEFIEPFYDPEVLCAVSAVPVDDLLLHHFYHRWVATFPPEFMKVAWQAYPGHEPCPVEAPEGLYTQWAPPHNSSHAAAFRVALTGLAASLRVGNKRRRVMRSHTVTLAYILKGAGLRDTSHLIRQVTTLDRALDKAHGRFGTPVPGLAAKG